MRGEKSPPGGEKREGTGEKKEREKREKQKTKNRCDGWMDGVTHLLAAVRDGHPWVVDFRQLTAALYRHGAARVWLGVLRELYHGGREPRYGAEEDQDEYAQPHEKLQ